IIELSQYHIVELSHCLIGVGKIGNWFSICLGLSVGMGDFGRNMDFIGSIADALVRFAQMVTVRFALVLW
ncbi:MAG: hypothetical protein AB7C90_10725, partial [Bacteroidales bacterium]